MFTDIINIFDTIKLPGQNLYQIVVADKVDKFIFKHHFDYVIDLADRLSSRLKIVNVNISSPKPDSANIYTIPREGINHKEYLMYSMNALIVHGQHSQQHLLPTHFYGERSGNLIQQHLLPTQLTLSEIGLCINQPINLNKLIWTVNNIFSPTETFKLLLQMLCMVDIKINGIHINEDMYTYIKQPLSKYSLYRHIMIYNTDNDQDYDNKFKLNPYPYSIPFPYLKTTYTSTGIPLINYP